VECVFGLAVILILTFSSPLFAAEIGKDVKVTYLGHAAFKIISPKGVVIYIDPFLSRNPKTPPEMKTVDKADLILVTHGHGDHVGDTLTIAEKTNAKIVAIAELGRYLKNKGGKNVVRMNKGGTYTSHGIGITMHYGTFGLLTGTPEAFLKLMEAVPQTKVLVVKPGETVQ